jgi:hypothetical protein
MKEKKFFFLTGVFRCGNTLLRSIINQNPNFLMTHNSLVPELTYKLHLVKNSNLFFEEADYDSFNSVISQVHKNYYQRFKQEYILEQGRWGTPYNYEILKEMGMLPTKFVVLIRPLKEIMASWIRVNKITKANVMNYLHGEMNEYGRIGQAALAIENLLNKKENILFIKYHELCKNPEKVIKELYNFLEIPFYKNHFYKNLKPVPNEIEQTKIRLNEIKLEEYDYDSYVPKEMLRFYKDTDELFKKYSS